MTTASREISSLRIRTRGLGLGRALHAAAPLKPVYELEPVYGIQFLSDGIEQSTHTFTYTL